jgi:hypothetical protein
MFACSASGWSATGVSCADNTGGSTGGASGGSGGTRSGGAGGRGGSGGSSGGAGGTRSGGAGGSGGGLGGTGGACQCTGVSPTGAPIAAKCGENACGAEYLWYACSASGWSLTGLTCPAGSGGTGGTTTPTCQCSGTSATGAPITARCGETVCGKEFQLFTCAAAGWSSTGLTCAGSNGGSGGSAGTSGKGGSTGTAGTGGKKGTGGSSGTGGTTSSCPPCIADTINACVPSGNCVQSTGTATQPATTCYDNGVEVQYFTIPSGDLTLVSAVVSKNGQSCYLLTVTSGSTGPPRVSLSDAHTMNGASGTVDNSGTMTVECGGKKYPLDNSCLLGSASTSCSSGTCP